MAKPVASWADECDRALVQKMSDFFLNYKSTHSCGGPLIILYGDTQDGRQVNKCRHILISCQNMSNE